MNSVRLNILIEISKVYTITLQKYRDSKIWVCEKTQLKELSPVASVKRYLTEGRKTSHNNFSSEPHSPHFLFEATSEFSSFEYYMF